ncbi:MAG: FlgD immunoglobulin-like domain containing protein [bacterium]
MIVGLSSAGSAITGLSGILRSDDPYVMITDSAGVFGNLGAGDTIQNEADCFTISVNSNAPIGNLLEFELLVNGTSDYACTLNFSIMVGDSMNLPTGPDGYGYYAYDNTDINFTQCPTFSWLEIGGVGTQLIGLGDDETRPVYLPPSFGPFRYYGVDYNQISICSNGWIAAGYTSMQSYNNESLPSIRSPEAIIAVSWDDYNPLYGGGVWYHHDVTNHCFIVEYDSVYYYGSETLWDKFQVIIYDTTIHTATGDNGILFQYQSSNNYGLNTVGIADHTRTIGLCYSFNNYYPATAAYLQSERAICLVTDEPTAVSEYPVKPGLKVTNSELKVWVRPTVFKNRTEIIVSSSTNNTKIAIYDRTGRLINSHAQLDRSHRFLWNGTDNAGRKVKAGVYFVVVQNELGKVKTRLIRIE